MNAGNAPEKTQQLTMRLSALTSRGTLRFHIAIPVRFASRQSAGCWKYASFGS